MPGGTSPTIRAVRLDCARPRARTRAERRTTRGGVESTSRANPELGPRTRTVVGQRVAELNLVRWHKPVVEDPIEAKRSDDDARLPLRNELERVDHVRVE